MTFTESDQSRKRTKFGKTNRMSTYQLSFAVIPDDYASEPVTTQNNIEAFSYKFKLLNC